MKSDRKRKIRPDDGRRALKAAADQLLDWQQNPAGFTPTSWLTFSRALTPIPFSAAILEVDRALWGSFWQGDVIGPGYRLPALELAYLRETRLTESVAEPSPQHYLQAIQTSLSNFPTGAWIAHFGRQAVLCLAYRQLVIWLIEGMIVAGYRANFITSPGYNLQPLLNPAIRQTEQMPIFKPLPLPEPANWPSDWARLDPATRNDRLIRLHRAYGRIANPTLTQTITAICHTWDSN